MGNIHYRRRLSRFFSEKKKIIVMMTTEKNNKKTTLKKVDFKGKELFPKKNELAKRLLKGIVLPNGEKVVF